MAYVELLLNKGHTTLIDCIDAPTALQYNWHKNDSGYVVWRGIKDGRKQTVRLHRLLMNPPQDMVIDHKNHDTLDNRRQNLRAVTQSDNMRNLTNQGKGYWFSKQIQRWVVEVNGKHRGTFDTEQDAADFVRLVRAGKADMKPKIERTECKHGHSLDDAYIVNDKKMCRQCQSIRSKAYFKRSYIPKPKQEVMICPRGHDKTITRTANGDCRECAKIRANQRRNK